MAEPPAYLDGHPDGRPVSAVPPGGRFAPLRRYAPLVGYFARRDLKALYKRSVLGWTWSLLNPLSTIVVYSFVFSVVFRAQAPPTASGSSNFAVFLFSGLVAWTFFSSLLTGSMGWMAAMGELRRKVYFPPEAAIFGSAVAVAVQASVEVAVLVVIMIVLGNAGVTTLLVVPVLLAAGVFGLGLGFALAVLNTRFRDVQYLVGIGLQALFFLTPIVYPIDIVPVDAWGGWPRRLIEANPLNQFVSATRECVYLLEWPSAGRWLALAAMSSSALALGWWYFSRRSMALSEEM